MTAAHPDPRSPKILDSFAVHHREIEAVRLSEAVPEPIAIQFETARNLYLYAWHVYRFYMVALAQALSTLELGLRTRLPASLPDPYQRRGQPAPMLYGLLGYAVDTGLVRNEGFRRWHEAASNRARERVSMDAIRTMIEQGLESVEFDDSDAAEVRPEDQTWDLVKHLRDGLPSRRNELAHGSTMLTRDVLGTLELVAEILNQLYPDPVVQPKP